MVKKKTIRVFYRAASHVPLWKVMEQGGFLEKYGVEIELGSMEGLRKKATEALRMGELHYLREIDDSGHIDRLYAGS